MADAGRHHRADAGRHPPLGRDHAAGAAAARRRRSGLADRFRPLGHRHPRPHQRLLQGDAGAHRRAQRLHAALRRRVLAGAGNAARRRRSHRGDPGARRHHLGLERGERRDQRDHPAQPRVHRRARVGRRRQRRSGARVGPLRRARTASALSYRVYAAGSSRDAAYHPDGHLYDDWSLAQGGFRVDFGRAAGRAAFPPPGRRLRRHDGKPGRRRLLHAHPAQLDVEGHDIVRGGNLVAGLGARAARRHAACACRPTTTARYGTRSTSARTATRSTSTCSLRTPVGRRNQVSWGGGARSSRSDITPVFPTL